MVLQKHVHLNSFDDFLAETKPLSEYICMYVYDKQQSSQLLQVITASLEIEGEMSPVLLLLEKSKNIGFLTHVKLPSHLPALLCWSYGTFVASTDNPLYVKNVLTRTKYWIQEMRKARSMYEEESKQ